MSLVEIFLLLFLLISFPSFYSLLHLLERGVETLEKMAASSEKASVLAEQMGSVLQSLPPFPSPSSFHPSSPSPKATVEKPPSLSFDRLPLPAIPPDLEKTVVNCLVSVHANLCRPFEITPEQMLAFLDGSHFSETERAFWMEARTVNPSFAGLWLKPWGDGHVLAWQPAYRSNGNITPPFDDLPLMDTSALNALLEFLELDECMAPPRDQKTEVTRDWMRGALARAATRGGTGRHFWSAALDVSPHRDLILWLKPFQESSWVLVWEKSETPSC